MSNEQREKPDAPPATAALPPRPSRWRRGLTAATILYCVAIALLWSWMRFEGDRSWLATLFLFGPRWICALPLALLVPLAVIWHRRLLWLLLLSGLLIVGPIMGFQVHSSSATAPYRLRVLTCNVNQMRIRLEAMSELIAALNPDIVALQEVPYNPPPLTWPRGWQVMQFDKLIVASRHPIVPQGTLPRETVPGEPVAVRCLIKLPSHDVQLFNLHLLTPRPGLEAVLDSKRGLNLSGIPYLDAILRVRTEESWLTSAWVASFAGPKIVVGDFNMPADSGIYRDTWSILQNAFASTGFGFGFTKVTEQHGWTYGARIDHILYSPPWQCVRAWVGPDIGSDHLPMLADFE